MKMKVMPRLLYHFQVLPVQIPSSFLRAVNQAFITFLWALKPPRLAQSILRLPKLRSGMALPDGNLYHMPCHMSRVLDWCHHSSLKQWVQVEQVLAGIPLESVLWCPTDLARQISDHPTIGERQRICLKGPSPLTSIVGNPAFI